jgi:5'-nucleotidase
MRLSSFIAGAALLSSGANALNILLGNDDGFGSGNLREMYRIFKEKGHNGRLSIHHDEKQC